MASKLASLTQVKSLNDYRNLIGGNMGEAVQIYPKVRTGASAPYSESRRPEFRASILVHVKRSGREPSC
jgi:hypothetical protein